MSDWPAPIAEQALHGPAGELVRLIEPHTEADPIALLIQFLVCFGVAAGRHAHLRIEASRHYPNEFCVLVGTSGKGRICCAQHMRPYVAVRTMLRSIEYGRRLWPMGVVGATYFPRDRSC